MSRSNNRGSQANPDDAGVGEVGELPPLPAGSLLDGGWITFRPASGGEQTLPLSRRLCAEMNAEMHRPVRSTPSFPGQKSKPGLSWMATTGEMVRFESRLESYALLEMDFDSRVLGVSSQPFRIVFPDASGVGTHVPDFYARMVGGGGQVVDVKPRVFAVRPDVVRQFEATRRLCEEVGWDYRVMHEPEPDRKLNLVWLSAFRRPPADVDVVAPHALDLVDAAGVDGVPWAALVTHTAGEAGMHPSLVIPALGHMVWMRDLRLDLDVLLASSSRVTAGGGLHVR